MSLLTSLRRWRFTRSVRRAAPGELRVVVGASGISARSWIPSEASFLNLLRVDDWYRYFGENSIDAIVAEHVWEHLEPREAATAARTCFRFLKPGGYLRLAVPDGSHPDPAYIEAVRPGGSGAGASDHRVLYDVESLGTLLSTAGFQVKPLEFFDRAGEFHERPWDPGEGMIRRSRRFDARNRTGLAYSSLIVDARKPAGSAAAPVSA